MEFIQTDHIASDTLRARAISDLVSIEVPLDIAPGPVGGGNYSIPSRSMWSMLLCCHENWKIGIT
ncbi:hypothetical protein N7501_010685 [Penicillium viridicatum]|nr:hypothetical protein N7501_010685 [Penicillium viridicatum]